MTSSTINSFCVVKPNFLPTIGFSSHIAEDAGSLVQPVWGSLVKSLSTSTVAGLITIASSVAFVPTQAPTAPLQLANKPIVHSPVSAVFANYETGDFDLVYGQNLLAINKEVFSFLAWFPRAVHDVYGEQVKISLRTVDDLETGAQIIEARVLSGLVLGDEFDRKDAELFEKIETSGLFSGLQHVVVSQG